MALQWHQTFNLPSKSFTCGYCGNPLASNVGYWKTPHEDGSGSGIAFIYICHHCRQGTFFDEMRKQTPGPRPGEKVEGIDDASVQSLYNEARDCFSKNAFTATILCARKLLMHIAISKGADPGKQFIEYVEFLASKNYIPPDAKDWVDHIRTKGNEANHEIVIMTEEEANDLLSFVTMLLKLVYEFPSKMRAKSKT